MINLFIVSFAISSAFCQSQPKLPYFKSVGANIRKYDLVGSCPQHPLDKSIGMSMVNNALNGMSTSCEAGVGTYVSTYIGCEKGSSDLKEYSFDTLNVVATNDSILALESNADKNSVAVKGWPMLETFHVLHEISDGNVSHFRGMKTQPQGSTSAADIQKFGYDIDLVQYTDIWCNPGEYVVELDIGYSVNASNVVNASSTKPSYVDGKTMNLINVRCSNEKQGRAFPNVSTSMLPNADNFKADKNGFNAVAVFEDVKSNSVKYFVPVQSRNDATQYANATIMPATYDTSGRLVGISAYYEKNTAYNVPFRKLVFLFENVGTI